jgi:hypothetical protein
MSISDRRARPAYIYFSVVQRKVVNPNDFFDTAAIAERLAGFEDRYNAISDPFDWTFTREDLEDFLKRIAQHDPAAPALLAAA